MTKEERLFAKNKELLLSTKKMKVTSELVKALTKDVKKGTASTSELKDAMKMLQKQANKIKLLTAESKVLGEWTFSDTTVLPPRQKINKAFCLLTILALIYLFSRS